MTRALVSVFSLELDGDAAAFLGHGEHALEQLPANATFAELGHDVELLEPRDGAFVLERLGERHVRDTDGSSDDSALPWFY